MIVFPYPIISGFPGVGKSTLAIRNPVFVRDLESSDFHWLKTSEGEKKENPQWPDNYIEQIKALRGGGGLYRGVLVSSHEQIRKLMAEAGIKYCNVVPENNRVMKNIMMERYRHRGSPKEFIDLMDENFEKFVESMINDKGAARVYTLDSYHIESWGDWLVS